MRARDLSRRRRKTRGRARAIVLKMTARRARGVIKHQGKGGDFGVGTKGKTRTEKAWGHGVQICPSRGSTLTFPRTTSFWSGPFMRLGRLPVPRTNLKLYGQQQNIYVSHPRLLAHVCARYMAGGVLMEWPCWPWPGLGCV